MAAQRLAELTREQAGRVAAECVLVVPIGSTEQHGPHLPAGTDALHAEWVAWQAAELAGADVPVVLAPTLAYGSSEHHLPFGATLSLDTETLHRVLLSIGRTAAASGFRQLFVLNGHGGNHDIAQTAVRDLALQQPLHAAAGSWWQIAWDELVAAGAGDHGRLPGHSGAFETAAVRAIAPHLVDEGAVPPGKPYAPTDPRRAQPAWRAELHGSWLAIDGWSDDPGRGDAATGRRLLDIAVAAVARAFVAFHAAATAAGPPAAAGPPGPPGPPGP
ncbi:MAG TPA: creatininase family protein [Acidimicrobiales bacterium]|nr:creatininase family protein [Acidimicrobiales bacterium]